MMNDTNTRPIMSDEDFDAIISKFESGDRSLYDDEFINHQFTPEQVIKICRLVTQWMPTSILTGQSIPSIGVDILLSSRHGGDRRFLLGGGIQLTPEQIGVLMLDPLVYTRRAAYRHPMCTDAMKVAYHLKWGE